MAHYNPYPERVTLPTDAQKSPICRRYFNLDPFSGHCFIFRNRRKTAVKVLLYDQTGFWLCHKRLSKGQFKQWPKSTSAVVSIKPEQLNQLLHQ